MPESSLNLEQITPVRNTPRGSNQLGTGECFVLTTFRPEMSTITPGSTSQEVLPTAHHCANVMSADHSNPLVPGARTRLGQTQCSPLAVGNRQNAICQNAMQPTGSGESPYPRVLSTTNWEVPRDHLSLFKRIGGGSFGQVWKGSALDVAGAKGWSTVAVKMLKGKKNKIMMIKTTLNKPKRNKNGSRIRPPLLMIIASFGYLYRFGGLS